MDIDKWLEGTVETAERTRLPDQLGFPAFLYPNGKPVLERSMRRHGKRMRHSADSSILTPDKPDAAPPRREPDSAQQLFKLLPSCQDSTRAPSSAHAADSDEDSGQYRRQPRRKTRPERYEAKTAKEPAKDQDRRKRKRGKQDKDAKPSRTRRKGRSGVADVVHTFHARNVPRERLTVRVLHLRVINAAANGSSCSREASSREAKHPGHSGSGSADVGPLHPLAQRPHALIDFI